MANKMKIFGKQIFLLICFSGCFGLLIGLECSLADTMKATSKMGRSTFDEAQLTGRLEDDRLIECSGMDISLSTDDLLWAVNDSGQGPYIYAMGKDGRSRGRLRVVGAQNRDWEGLDTFMWQGRPMILIADFGDNRAQYDLHTLYIIEEPVLDGERFPDSSIVQVAWRIVYSYPDRNHDAESVAVDVAAKKVLVLTKRDLPPLLFEVPLIMRSSDNRVVAKKVAEMGRIPPPLEEDMAQKYGKYRAQPTAMDFSPDGRLAVVLTHKDAYLFKRRPHVSWAIAFSGHPVLIPLPLPQDRHDFRQREAICFAPGGHDLLVTSEGLGAGIFRLKVR